MKSPIYWSIEFYETALNIALGPRFDKIFSDVAALIPNHSSVLDLCCGTALLKRVHLDKKTGVTYAGIDINHRFVSSLRRRGLDVSKADVRTAPFPKVDYVVMCSSLHLMNGSVQPVFTKMMEAARKAVIISEPVVNFARHSNRFLSRLAQWLGNTGAGDCSFRYDIDSFHAFCRRNNAASFYYQNDEPIAVAVFQKGPPA
jgi:SAM-dependent methyltransferase